MTAEHDFDWIVIGSGFGGSVSALRLAEKGYRVAVLEAGRRYRDEDFAKTTWNARRYYWLPRLGLKGIFRMTLFKDVFVVSGCGVGGGSLGYANTLYRPTEGSAFYRDPQWSELEDWESALAPHYETAEKMLGVTRYEGEGPADRVLREIAGELGVEDTYSTTRVGVFFGEPGKTVADPYFGGEGPPRAGCIRCGACMVGCRHNAKNTLPKNYLYFAERAGVQILPERTVAEVRPLGARRRQRRLRRDQRALRRVVRQGPPDADRQGRRRRRRPARHQPAAPALPDRRRAPPPLQAASATSCARTPRRSRPSPPRTTATTSRSRSRSPRASIPTPTRTSRTSPTAPAPTRSRSCSRSSAPPAASSPARSSRASGRGGR